MTGVNAFCREMAIYNFEYAKHDGGNGSLQLRSLCMNRSILVLFLLYCGNASATEWEAVSDPSTLRALFSDTVMEATLTDGVEAEATYNSDGTGELRAWGESFPRTWEVRGNDQVCIGMGREVKCFSMERSAEQADTYRATDIASGEQLIIKITRADGKLMVDSRPDTEVGAPAPEGGAAKPSVDEIAKELSNPNTSLASLTLKLQYRSFKGDLDDADDQDSTTILFQPALPFKRDDGSKIIFRPAIPFIVDQPLFQGGSDWDEETGLGDIAFDLAYAFAPEKEDPGKLVALGIFSSLPTGDDDLGLGETTTLGPEFLYGRISKELIWGLFPNHQWDVGGDIDVNLTTLQVFYFKFAAGGVSYGTSPIMTFDHEEDEWTVPLNLTVSKTVIFAGRPWKIGGEINYYVEQADAFGPEWMVSFNIAPVVVNVMADWFK
jgi:hypothetical protein